jgi:hypothetical protein
MLIPQSRRLVLFAPEFKRASCLGGSLSWVLHALEIHMCVGKNYCPGPCLQPLPPSLPKRSAALDMSVGTHSCSNMCQSIESTYHANPATRLALAMALQTHQPPGDMVERGSWSHSPPCLRLCLFILTVFWSRGSRRGWMLQPAPAPNVVSPH